MRRVVLGSALAAAAALAHVACAAIAGLSDPEDVVDATVDALPPSRDDATIDGGGIAYAGPPTASFDFLCNGVVLKRHSCPRKRWEHDPCAGGTSRSLVLRNTGRYPIGYIARRAWVGGPFVPSIASDGGANELVGVLAPGGQTEIASAYNGGTVAILGSLRPFAAEAKTDKLDDEGVVAWQNGEFAGTSTTAIDVAQITVTNPDPMCWNILNPDRRHFD